MSCNIDLLCCGNNNFSTPQDFYFANIALLCAIRTAVLEGGGGGGTPTTDIVWENCFQYLPEGETELVTFTRRYVLDTLTGVTTTYDFDKLTGDPVVVPVDAVLSVCPSCCEASTTSYLTNEFTTVSFAQDDMTTDLEVLPAPGAGLRYEIRYLSYNNESAIAANFEFTSGGAMYTNYLPQNGIWATRFQKDDYLVLGENQNLTLTGSASTNATIEYRIIPV